LFHKQLSTLRVSMFYDEQFRNVTLGGIFASPKDSQIWFPERLLNLIQTIVSQTTSYILSLNFLCSAVQKFHFGKAIGFALPPPPGRTLKFGQAIKKHLLKYNIPCYYVILYIKRLDNQNCICTKK